MTLLILAFILMQISLAIATIIIMLTHWDEVKAKLAELVAPRELTKNNIGITVTVFCVLLVIPLIGVVVSTYCLYKFFVKGEVW